MTLSDAASFIAVLVSTYTFYWVQIKKVRRLHLVKLEPLRGSTLSFVLMNAGNEDLLITAINWIFPRNDGSGSNSWHLLSRINRNEPILLHPGESKLVDAEIREEDRAQLMADSTCNMSKESGRVEYSTEIEVRWFDASPTEKKAKVPMIEVGFAEGLGGTFSQNVHRSYELNAEVQ